jgi:hypothetical protein
MTKLPIVAILYPTKAELDKARADRMLRRTHVITPQQLQDLINESGEHLSDIDISDLANEVAPRYGSLQGAYNYDGDFLWVTHKGDVYLLADMATPHLFYSLRMLYNHSVPPVFRVVGPGESMKRYNDVPDWDAEYRTTALRELAHELNKRDDLDDSLQQQYDDIIANSRVIVALGI